MLILWLVLCGGDFDTRLNEAFQENRQGNYQAVYQITSELVVEGPTHSDLNLLHGLACLSLGKVQESIQANIHASKQPSLRGVANYNLACAYALLGDGDKAVQHLKAALQAKTFFRAGIENDSDLASLMGRSDLPLVADEIIDLDLGDGDMLRARIMLPKQFDKSQAYPLLIGLGPGQGREAGQLWAVQNLWGTQASYRSWISVSPLAPEETWFSAKGQRLMKKLVSYLKKAYLVEHAKVHLVGCSNGGVAAMHLALSTPEHWASITLCPGAVRDDFDFDALKRVKADHVWLCVGGQDQVWWIEQANDLHRKLSAAGINTELKVFTEDSHVLASLVGGELIKKLERFR